MKAQYTEDGMILVTYDDDTTAYVPDDMENRDRQMLAEWEAEGNVIEPYVAPPPAPYDLAVSDIWGRMTDAEAEAFDAAMSVAPPLRLRKQFNSASIMTSDSELFNFTKGVLTSSIGAARTGEVMAR